jgi:hypothetical protein
LRSRKARKRRSLSRAASCAPAAEEEEESLAPLEALEDDQPRIEDVSADAQIALTAATKVKAQPKKTPPGHSDVRLHGQSLPTFSGTFVGGKAEVESSAEYTYTEPSCSETAPKPQELPTSALLEELRRRRPHGQGVPADVASAYPELCEGVAS